MTGSKTAAGLALLCALCLVALSASSASAAFTTAGECAKSGTKDFEDAHCDKAKAGGEFGHILFANGVKTDITTTNDLTGTKANATFEGKIAGVVFNVKCGTATGTGSVTNNAGGSTTFGPVAMAFLECVVEDRPAVCAGSPVTVAKSTTKQTGPHNLKISTAKKIEPTGLEITFHEENPEGTEMGFKFVENEVDLTTLTFVAACGFGTNPIPVKGFVYATPGRGGAATSSGATAIFSKSSTIGGLTVAGTPAYLDATLTLRKSGGNPLILTTKE
jgi:hypothetical protein